MLFSTVPTDDVDVDHSGCSFAGPVSFDPTASTPRAVPAVLGHGGRGLDVGREPVVDLFQQSDVLFAVFDHLCHPPGAFVPNY